MEENPTIIVSEDEKHGVQTPEETEGTVDTTKEEEERANDNLKSEEKIS